MVTEVLEVLSRKSANKARIVLETPVAKLGTPAFSSDVLIANLLTVFGCTSLQSIGIDKHLHQGTSLV